MNIIKHLSGNEKWEPRLSAGENCGSVRGFLSLLLRIAVVSFAFCSAFQIASVCGSSMYPTLLDGDVVILQRIFYEPAHGDIVVIRNASPNGDHIVTRVIATGGDTVNIDFSLGVVYVNDCPLDEPYVACATTVSEGMNFPLTVPDGDIFVLGDNRSVSLDSRSPLLGCVDKRRILGHMLVKLPSLRSTFC